MLTFWRLYCGESSTSMKERHQWKGICTHLECGAIMAGRLSPMRRLSGKPPLWEPLLCHSFLGPWSRLCRSTTTCLPLLKCCLNKREIITIIDLKCMSAPT